jgi:SAM-dependent methyltransferase
VQSALQARIAAWSRSPSPLLRALARSLRAAGAARRFLLNPRLRSEQLTRWQHRDTHLQGATYSEPNRYPELFAACSLHLRNTPAPAILSFGCATGEEALALAAYLPHASIVGADINRWCLRQAERNNRNPRVRFLHAASPEFAALANLDAIFAMAVLQRSENRTHTAPVAHSSFPFARFEQEIARLDAKLKPGGLLFLDHADFRFEDTPVAARYTPLLFPGSQIAHNRPLFGPGNTLIATRYTMQRAFQKRS